MEVIELVRFIKSNNIEINDLKVNYMHGKPHDLMLTIQRTVKGTLLEAVVTAENMASFWPFCSYNVIPVKSGYQVIVTYKVKTANIFAFRENFTLQLKESML